MSIMRNPPSFLFFFFNDTATTEIYTLSLHDALPIYTGRTHQIRVHFSALKHPVVGDTLYGAARQLNVGVGSHRVGAAGALRLGKTALAPPGRNFLHAAKLRLAPPRAPAWVEGRAAFPGGL